MKNKFISALLCAALVLSLSPAALAADAAVDEREAAQVLSALDSMTGDENGDLNLSAAVTRAEFTKLVVAASPYADGVGPAAAVAPYPDVPRTNWAAPYVQTAKEKGLAKGYLDGTFRPMNGITLVEGVSMVLSLLGYQNGDFSGAWGSGQMAMYQTLKLDKGLSAGREDPLTRRDCLWLFYNLLTAKNKTGQVYLTTLGHSLTASGEIDRVALINSAMEGPVVAEGSWREKIPFDTARATVYRAGTAAALGDIRATDVVYWSKSMRTLWTYTSQITGSVQAVTPSASAPAAVTVAGRSYPLETSVAVYDLSDLGAYRVGDSVTLLLGRDGGVAAVRGGGETAGTVCGVVTALGSALYQDKDGKSYSAPNVTITATDGMNYTYQWENKNDSLEAGDLVQVTTGSGGVQIRRPSTAKLSGTVSTDGKQLGDYTLSADVEILDTYGKTSTLRIYPTRLAGVTLSGDMVRYHSLNVLGEIDRLILKDVTGDLHGYGVLTAVSETSAAKLLVGSYTYDMGGTSVPFVTQEAIWNLEKGPCQIKGEGTGVDRIYNLTEVTLYGVDGNTARGGSQSYTLADGVAVYELRDKKYYLTDLSRVDGGDYTLTGAYDKSEREGGRIRVIVAQAK